MSGTKAGGLRAAQTNKERHGEDFYARIGAMGGRNGHTGGFAANPALAKLAGKKGGIIGRRGIQHTDVDEKAVQKVSRDIEAYRANRQMALR